MNLLFRILVAIYAVIASIISGLIMISPFADKQIMEMILSYADLTFYRSNRYDILIFLLGLLFLFVNLVILSSGIRMRHSSKFFCFKNEHGVIRVSANSIENIALSVARKSTSIRDAKAKAKFKQDSVEVTLRLVVYPDTQVPTLSELLQENIQSSIETMTELKVGLVDVNIEGVHATSGKEG